MERSTLPRPSRGQRAGVGGLRIVRRDRTMACGKDRARAVRDRAAGHQRLGRRASELGCRSRQRSDRDPRRRSADGGTRPAWWAAHCRGAEVLVRHRQRACVVAPDGTFAGWLPSEGHWNVQITPNEALQRVRTRVDVRIPPNGVRAQVPIDLPGGRIEGTVVDEESNPVADVEILVLQGTDIAANGGSDSEGRFAIVGLEPGSFVLYARTRDLFSDHQPSTVSAASATKQTLVLRGPAERSGRLVRSSGAPVIGALIRYFRGDEMLTAVERTDGHIHTGPVAGSTRGGGGHRGAEYPCRAGPDSVHDEGDGDGRSGCRGCAPHRSSPSRGTSFDRQKRHAAVASGDAVSSAQRLRAAARGVGWRDRAATRAWTVLRLLFRGRRLCRDGCSRRGRDPDCTARISARNTAPPERLRGTLGAQQSPCRGSGFHTETTLTLQATPALEPA